MYRQRIGAAEIAREGQVRIASEMVDIKSEELNGETEAPEKSAKQLQKEAKKLAKLEKFKQKQGKKESEKPPKVKEKNEVSNGVISLESFAFLRRSLLRPVPSIWSFVSQSEDDNSYAIYNLVKQCHTRNNQDRFCNKR